MLTIIVPETKKFELGCVVIAPQANARLSDDAVNKALERYCNGDWGVVSDNDKFMNDEAVKTGDDFMLGAYINNGIKFWIKTEWDRSVTTILLPEEN